MLLKNKNAIIYEGGGAVDRAVARAFAREGAKVFLASASRVDKVFRRHAKNAGISGEAFEKGLAERTEAAVLAVSNKASAITAAVFNVTCGELAD